MSRWIWTCATVFLCIAIMSGCNKQANDQDAIRASIEKRLNGLEGLNMSAMDHEIKQISVNGDHATAQVEFRVKGGDAHMYIEYTLERQGKDWAVQNSQPMGGGSPHSGMGMPPSNVPDSGGSSIPPGHPPTN
jgi:hypothetical protein